MANFVAICSKNGQRVELSLVRANIEDAKAELHNQGYAIIEIRETAESADQAGNSLATFYFDILVEGKQKSGQIKSSDSFRAYIKLVDDLHYQVLAIYDNPSANEEERRFFTNKIREMYAVYKERNKGGAKPAEEPQSGRAKPTEADESRSGSLMERQVAKYHALIEQVVLKVEFLAANYSEQLGEDRLFRLKELITALKQLKNIQNLDKLRIVGEAALEKIGQLEVEFIEKGYIREKKDTLKDTNSLLKGIGSSEGSLEGVSGKLPVQSVEQAVIPGCRFRNFDERVSVFQKRPRTQGVRIQACRNQPRTPSGDVLPQGRKARSARDEA
ncbi:MAG: hypothetical protein QMC36_02105 [Patescibacteria group bacterium]